MVTQDRLLAFLDRFDPVNDFSHITKIAVAGTRGSAVPFRRAYSLGGICVPTRRQYVIGPSPDFPMDHNTAQLPGAPEGAALKKTLMNSESESPNRHHRLNAQEVGERY